MDRLLIADPQERRLHAMSDPMHPLVTLLLAFDIFIFGGLVALQTVHRMLVAAMERQQTAGAQATIYNLMDHMIPYHLGFAGALVALLLLTGLAMMLVPKSRRR